MKVVFQEEGSSVCGQCCVAMVADITLEKSIEIFGHSHATKAKELAAAFKKLEIESDIKLTRCKKYSELPNLCIIRIRWNEGKNKSHWAVHYNGFIYDSAYGSYWPSGIEHLNGRLTSYLKIEEKT